jgi:murein DD-endopeptidase MepM/ murein hydrolase activator NlpD
MFVLVFFFCIVQPLVSQQQGNERFTQMINRLVDAMNNQDYNRIVQEYDKGMATAFPLFKTTYFFKNNYETFGKVLKVDPPQVRAADQALCVLYSERGIQDLTMYLDDEGKIKGFLFTTHIASQPPSPSKSTAESNVSAAQTATLPAAVSGTQSSQPDSAASSASLKERAQSTSLPSTPPTVPDKQQTELFLPFTGTWTIAAGGEPGESTTSRTLLQQQFAYNFIGNSTTGLRYRSDGKVNEDYFVYGKDILAPANGTVVEVIDGIRENTPGTRNPYAIIGNAIILQHASREYSVLAFLKTGSIRVKVGERISRGQVLAQCGNSGYAAEPALHYHLQDAPYLQTAKGIKFYFERVLVTKERKKQLQLNHLPMNGDVVSPE